MTIKQGIAALAASTLGFCGAVGFLSQAPAQHEKAVIRAEQPESRWPSRSEAPDSGEFAGHFLENVFKNGRSKS